MNETEPKIDEQLLRSVNRQLRAIKLMLSFFFIMLLAMLAILGFVTYKVITFTQDVQSKIDSIEDKASRSLDFRGQVCDNKTLTGFLGRDNNICE